MDLSKCVCTSDLEVLDLDDPGADMWSEVWKKPCGWENLDRIVVDEDEADALVGRLEGMPYEGSELVMNPALPEFTCIVRKEGRQEETLVAFKKTILPPEGPSYEQGGTRAVSRHAIDAYVHINNGGSHADEIISIGQFIFSKGGEKVTSTYSHIVWTRYDNPMLADGQANMEFSRNVKLLYMAVQKALYDRPSVFVTGQGRPAVRHEGRGKGRKKEEFRKVKAVRMIRLSKEEMTKYCAESRKMNCPSWGVIGHWRNYKSGRRVWIHPYRKGRERNNPGQYAAKEYEIGGTGNA